MNNKNKIKKDRFAEYSKFILFLFAVSYFVGGTFLIWVVFYQITHAQAPEYVTATDIVVYFTAPITAGLLAYFGKAVAENVEKIKKDSPNNANSIKDDISKG